MATPHVVWITGAGGLIGSYLVKGAPSWVRAIPIVRCELDLTDFRNVQRRFDQEQPDLVIHCAALSKSPACQANPEQARLLNVEVTRFLSQLCAPRAFLFFSTDLVFDGQKGNYVETDVCHPLSVYGETKAEAEAIVLENPRHAVVRISLNGGASPSGDRGFNEEMRRAWEAGRKLSLFIDEYRNPLPAEVTARAVWELAGQSAAGIYHVAGRERLSRYEIGRLLAARRLELNPQMEGSSLKTYQGAPRAPDTSLNCDKAQRLLSFRLPGLREWLEAHPEKSF